MRWEELELGAKVRAYDPRPGERAEQLPAGLQLAGGVTELGENADALVLVTDWPEFQGLPFEALAQSMRHPLMVDGRNCLNRQTLQEAGFEYIGIGR